MRMAAQLAVQMKISSAVASEEETGGSFEEDI
jgi:hypothetical protein